MLKFSSASEAHLDFLQVQVSVDEGSGLPVIVPVAIRKGGEGAAEERKSQVRYLFLVVALMDLIQTYGTEAPVVSEFLNLLRISEFFGFQWQNLSEILSLFFWGHFG